MKKAATALAMVLGAIVSQPALANDICLAFRWTTLETAGGPVPTPDRSEPANMLELGDMVYLIDTGDGTIDGLAQLGRDVGEVSAVFISHLHWDHVGGLSAVLGLRWMNTFTDTITVYGPPGTEQIVDSIVASLRPQERVGFGTGARMPDPATNIIVVEIADSTTIDLGAATLTAVTNSHFDQSLEEVGTVSLSYRFDMGSRSITYTGDTGPSDAVTQLANGSDMLVSEVIALEPLVAEILDRRADMPPPVQASMRQHLATHHIDASVVGEMAAQAGVEHVVLTHFAMPPVPLHVNEPYLRDGVRQHYDGPLDLARDLSSFDVGCE